MGYKKTGLTLFKILFIFIKKNKYGNNLHLYTH